MTVVYWEGQGCGGPLCPVGTMHIHCSSEREVPAALAWVRRTVVRSNPRDTPTTLLGPPFSVRNFCVTGPGGLVREVLWSPEEIAEAIGRTL